MSITRKGTGARMSASVSYNGMVFLSGQVGDDFSSTGLEDQAKSVLAKIDGLLADAGTDKTKLISATIYLKDIANDFNKMNPVWEAWLPEGGAPARATVEAPMAHPDILIEISIIAAA